MTLIKGIPDVEMLDFSKMSDEQLMKITINIDLTSKEEANVFLEELKKRNLEYNKNQASNKKLGVFHPYREGGKFDHQNDHQLSNL